jgi:hypothetical protein
MKAMKYFMVSYLAGMTATIDPICIVTSLIAMLILMYHYDTKGPGKE